MPIQIYNTLTGQKEEFKSLKKGKVGMYHCGPTVYDTAHIGNLRTFIMNDTIRRVFEHENYDVTQVMNITDVDDKTMRKSKEENTTLERLTKHYETLFLADIHSLNILTPHKLLSARNHVKNMIEMISTLLDKGIAYPTKDGIYFGISKFKDYGKLAKINLSDETKERIANDEYDKENPRDFALWKFRTGEDGEVSWHAVFGEGRPGWHIECSAMATAALGPTIDIHTGGTDLIFPHHTNEIAQSEAATGKTFVNYWIHGAFMNVDDTKMAKSKGNFLKLSDLEEAGISPLAFRYWLLTSHYRSQVNFSIEAVKAAQNAFVRLIETFIRLGEVQNEHVHAAANPREYAKEFSDKITNDLDTPGAVALMWDLIKDHSVEAKEKIELMLDFDEVFGLGLHVVLNMKDEMNEAIPAEITALAEARELARVAKEFDKADALRKEISTRGYEIKDNPEGYILKKIK
ncbi:MAG: cysteine--tRNA ligase [Patescibacteria group bacterium]